MRLIDADIIINKLQVVCDGIDCMSCQFNHRWSPYGDDGCALKKLILESAVVDAEVESQKMSNE